MGSSEFSVPTLEALHRSRHPVVAVVTTPDRPQGRGLKPAPTPVKRFALENNLRVLDPDNLNEEEFLSAVALLGPSIGVLAAYGKIVPRRFLGILAMGLINVHPSLLPRHRGPSPIQETILRGDAETGVTYFLVDRHVDHGPILRRVEARVEPRETAQTLHDRLARLGADHIVPVLEDFATGTIKPVEQDESQATHTTKLDRLLGEIAWEESADNIDRLVRALQPWPGTRTRLEKSHLKIIKGTPVEWPKSSTPGTILNTNGRGIQVACGKGSYLIEEIQPENRRIMMASEFISGHPLGKAARFA